MIDLARAHPFGFPEDRSHLGEPPPAPATGPDDARPSVSLEELPAGDETAITLRRMADVAAWTLSRDPQFVMWVREQVRHVPARDYLGELQAAFDAIKREVKFRRDPVFLEWVQAPGFTIRVDKQEDCDGFTTIMLAAALALGHGARLRVVKANPRARDKWSHVYAVVGYRVGPKHVMWWAADCSQDKPFGWEPEMIYGKADVVVHEP